jgi:hypothetical protein
MKRQSRVPALLLVLTMVLIGGLISEHFIRQKTALGEFRAMILFAAALVVIGWTIAAFITESRAQRKPSNGDGEPPIV